MLHLSVMLPVSVWQCYTYASQEPLSPGTVVRVSFGSRLVWGVVTNHVDPETSPSFKVKPVLGVHPWLRLSPSHMAFITAMARYVMCPEGVVLKMTLPSALALGDMELWQPLADSSHREHAQTGLTVRQLASMTHTSLVAMRAHIKQGMFQAYRAIESPKPISTATWVQPIQLTEGQEKALQSLKSQSQGGKTVVLEGVTGSGKTEVLLKLCQDFWAKGQQVLILLPEILLSHPWQKRVAQYVDVPTTIWHSKMSARARQEGFEDTALGRSLLVIGTRSAVTLPFAQLGAIMVDEEHENAFKQGDGVLYHGRDMAILRGYKENVPIVLASATPSLETRHHGMMGKYGWVTLEARFGSATLPQVACVDMRLHAPKDKSWLSQPLVQEVHKALDRGDQALLFLNRRGFASLWMCCRCQHRASCPHCSAWLTVHERPACLLCHYCGLRQDVPTVCPGCQDDQCIVWMGAGVERIEQEAKRCFPHASIAILSSDHMGSTQTMDQTLNRIQTGDVNLLIGTQLIAKGYHFPHLTCIGVVDTDFALSDVDFRSHEKLFQLMTQVSGRAGRGHKEGMVWLQTWQPEHPLFRDIAQHDWTSFVTRELHQRHMMDNPPFVRLTSITVAHRTEWEAHKAAQDWGRFCPSNPRVKVFGPAPAPMNPLRDWWRWRFLVKSPLGLDLYAWLKTWLEGVPPDIRKGVQLSIDRDPVCFL